MWNLLMTITRRTGRSGRKAALAGALLVGLALLAGCGSSTNSALSSSSHSFISNAPSTAGGSSASAGSAAGAPSQQKAIYSPQYLIKSLNVNMTMPDTRATINDLQNWITTTDPKAQTAGATYSLDGSQYDITVIFSVQASLYPQIKSYLADYAAQHHGQLISLNESVQDVSTTYVDAQSQLANLRVEQARLQTLMGRAQSMTDILSIEQRLSDVEGQIEQIEAQLNQLNGQTTFYSIQIQLLPLASYNPPVTQPWSPSAIFHQALSSAQAFGEGLLTLLIWLGVYAIYIIPLGIIIWLIVRFMRRRSAQPAVSSASNAPPVA